MGWLGYCLWKSTKVLFVLILVLASVVALIPTLFTLFPELPKYILFRNAAFPASSYEPTAHNLTGHNFYLPLNTGLIPVWHLVPLSDYSANNSIKSMEKMVNGNRSIILIVHGAFHSRYHPKKHPIYSKFLDAGYHVITFDFRGFGENVGDADGFVAVEETKAVYRWLRNKVGSRRILVWASSLGGAFTIEAFRTLQSLEKQLPRLVLESTFASTVEITNSAMGAMAPIILFSARTMMKDYHVKFDNAKLLPKLKTDIFHMHSEMDQLIPYKHANIISKAMRKNGRDETSIDRGTYRLKIYDASLNLPHMITSSRTYNCVEDVKDFIEMTNIELKMNHNGTAGSY